MLAEHPHVEAREAREHRETRRRNRSRARAVQGAKYEDTLQFLGVGSQHKDVACFSKSERHF